MAGEYRIGDALLAREVLKVAGQDKDELFRALARAAAGELGTVNEEQVANRLRDREQMLSTRLGDNIAMPHAQFADIGNTVVIVAVCPDGIVYDAHENALIHLAFCIVGDQANHLDTLSGVAVRLQVTGTLDALIRAAREGDRERVYRLLTAADGDEDQTDEGDARGAAKRAARSQRVWRQALQLAPMVGARCILLHTSSSRAKSYQVPPEMSAQVFVMTPEDLGMPSHAMAGSATGSISISLLYALTEQRIRQDDVIVNVYGAHEPGVVDTIQVTDVEAAFRLFFSVSRELSLGSSTQRVMLRVVELAVELAAEGREGKPAGALFVVGDSESVREHCHQMLMNPFKGYDERHRNILDPGLTETVKELSRIDGAFIVTDDGVIESAGTYLRVDVDIPNLPSGLGARHTAAASITAVSEAVAVAISESTRQVSIFRHGRRVVVL
ncbi:MAG: diadenylate cyclase [Spirochaetota bacterium]